jgi:tRNA A-37 threonylcarbamoyl transferase component Bud32
MLDPNNERYNRYYLPEDLSKCIKSEDYKNDIKQCLSKGHKINKSNIVFQRMLEPLDLEILTRKQYRYLRDSLELLHANGITHGDLPSNIMLHPGTNMPIIIDWENAKLNSDNLDKQIDTHAFLTFFKVAKSK